MNRMHTKYSEFIWIASETKLSWRTLAGVFVSMENLIDASAIAI